MKKQSKGILFGIAGFVVLIVGIKAFSSSAPLASSADSVQNSELTLSETNWNWGEILMSKGITTKEITITNNSPEPIIITRMETSCMCTTAQILHANGSKSGLKGMVGHGGNPTLSETINAGEKAILLINFDPNAHGPNAVGPITRTVMIETNSKKQPEIKLTFSGNVKK